MGFCSKAKAALLTIAILASFLTILANIPQAGAQTANVTFTIMTSDGTQPIRWAIVRINGTNLDPPTNATGQVTISNINPEAIQTSLQVVFRGVTVANIPGFKVKDYDSTSPYQVTLRVNVTTMRINARTALGNPVSNVRLSLSYGAYTNATTTGGDGSASIPLMPNTTYTVSASYRGYDVGVFTAPYGGSPLTLTLNLFSIHVTVQDMEGNPVPSAAVRVWYGVRQSGNTTGFASAETDGSGVAVVDRLPSGNYPLNVEYRGETVYQSPAAIAVSSGSINHVARTDLVRYRVRVLDADGVDLITGISLEGRLYRDNTQYGDPATTSSGELSFGLVRSRPYILVVRMGDVEVFRGEVNAPLDASVRGKFYDAVVRVDASGTPSERLVSTVTVKLSISNYNVEKTTSNGVARFDNLPVGRYSYEITRGTYIIGTGNIEVNMDEARPTIRPTLYTLKLKLTNDVGEGIAASAQLRTYDDVVLGVFQAGENGEATVSGLIPILYRGVVTYRNVRVHDGFEFLMDQNNKEVVVQTKVYNVVFRLMDFDGEVAVANAELSVTAEGITESATTNSTGKAAVKNLPVGSYTVRASYLNIPVHEETVRVEASRELALRARGIIDVGVEVVDDDSVPLEAGSVMITLGAAKFSGDISGGKIRFANIPAGTYRLSVQYKGFTVYDRQASFSTDEDSVRIPAAVYYLRLTVVKSDGTPLAAASVAAVSSAKTVASVFTDQSGRAELKLPRGDFSIDVLYQDAAVHSQTLSVTQSTILNIKAKVYRVDVRIITPDGLPVQGAEVSVSRGNKLVEKGVTDDEGRARLYIAEGDYSWTMRIGGYTYTSSYSSRLDKELAIVHVEEKPQWQGVVLAATAAVSFSSVAGLIRWGRTRPAGRQRSRRQTAEPERRPATLKRTRPPRV
ncbi:MAG: carboxypeptidase regulatory-like domain-containing protein [Candidatus Caldarchaeum sp.]